MEEEQLILRLESKATIDNTILAPGDIIQVPKFIAKELRGLATITQEEPHMRYDNGKVSVLIDTKPDALQQQRADVRFRILRFLNNKERDSASEYMAQYIQDKMNIYTLADDKQPEVWIYHNGIYISNGITYIKEEMRNIMLDNYTGHYGNLVMEKIMLDTIIDKEDFFNNCYIDEVAVQNGLLNLETGELTDFTPDRIHFQKLPVIYNPEKDCPMIKKFFKDILKNDEDIPVVQEVFGYLLLKEYRIEKAVMLSGSGRNGKSKFMDLIKRFLGPENCSSISLQDFDKIRFNMSEVHNKLANISGDLDRTALKHTGSFKQLVGRDLITGNRKNKTNIYFENYAKMIFAANELPITYDLTPAFFNRWIILEFPYTFLAREEIEEGMETIWIRERNPDIIREITTPDELSGLLNWAIAGLKRLLEKKDFSNSKSVEETKTLWLRKSDSFTAFCLDRIEEEYGSTIRKGELRFRYSEYCKKHKVRSIGDKGISEILSREYGAYEGRENDYNRTRVWEGIKFKDTTPKYADWVEK